MHRASIPWLAAVVMLAAGIACGTPASDRAADDPRAFFRGAVMTYIVPTTPGGGYDTYARLLAEFFERRLELARVVVLNVPGSGHIVGANQIYAARPDGLTLGTFSPGILYAQLVGVEALRADLRRMSWIGQPSEEPQVLIASSQSGLRSVEDLRAAGRPLLVGVSDRGSRTYYDVVLLMHALGVPATMVFGLSTTGAQLSMRRGEIDLRLNTVSSIRQFVAEGHAHPVVRVSATADDADRGTPDAGEFVSSESGRRAVAFVRRMAAFARWTVGPPAIPEPRLRLLRETYAEAMSDPTLLERASRMDIPIGPVRLGDELGRDIQDALDQPADFVAFVRTLAGRSSR